MTRTNGFTGLPWHFWGDVLNERTGLQFASLFFSPYDRLVFSRPYAAAHIFFLPEWDLELNTTLLRERFVIRDLDPDQTRDDVVEAMSNRIVIPLANASGQIVERFVVRTQVMHMGVRLAAQIIQTFASLGPIMSRDKAFDFEGAWRSALSSYDIRHFPNPWVCVYKEAKPVFQAGTRHPFLDIVEKCDVKNPGNYDQSLAIAEDTFKKMGRSVSIAHNSNIGMVVHVKNNTGRCGMILRNPHKSTTFNFVATKGEDDLPVTPFKCLNSCAAFLEGIQLSVRVGIVTEKQRQGLIPADSPEFEESTIARARLAELSTELRSFENQFQVHYRLERPEFKTLIREAELFQRQLTERGGAVI